MNFKEWSYRRKNIALVPAAILLLLLCWFLAFGKTYRLAQDYRALRASLSESSIQRDGGLVQAQLDAQLSLLDKYSADSIQWVGGLLGQIGDLLSGYPVEVNYENRAVGLGELTVERELELKGSFESLQKALLRLESRFYVKNLQSSADKDGVKYNVRLVIVKKDRLLF